MKKKFLVFTLCFTLVFTSINYKKSYADGGIISLPILATVSALAVGTGIVINNNDDLYDLGRLFYDYIDKHNDITWDMVKTVFSTSVVLANNKLVSVKSDFLNIVKDFFDNTFSSSEDIVVGDFNSNGFPTKVYNVPIELLKEGYIAGDFKFVLSSTTLGSQTTFYIYQASTNKLLYNSSTWCYQKYFNFELTNIYNSSGRLRFRVNFMNESGSYTLQSFSALGTSIVGGVSAFPYNGGYTWDNINDRKEENNISLPIPGNLGDLVGTPTDTFWDNTDNLINGGLSIPDVSNPSIDIDDSISFPTVGDVPSDTPSDTPFSNITEYIIGLVVPSDMYWTDTFNSLQNNFISSFPFVDMSSFNSLSINGKPFPNIDVNIMGSKGRIVNGDTVNSIVDWLRPIIAGFVLLCLMFFNYRKLYKLIRNSEPFEGIGKVENHVN